MKLRYATWRRSVTLGGVIIALCFAGGIFYREERWVGVFDVLRWLVVAGGVTFHVVVTLLKKTGLLEFTYTEADRASYLYNMEELHRQMTGNRRARKRE